jgi:hypothetical protein
VHARQRQWSSARRAAAAPPSVFPHFGMIYCMMYLIPFLDVVSICSIGKIF